MVVTPILSCPNCFRQEDAMKKAIGAGIVLALVGVAYGVFVSAEPATGVTPTVLARGTYEPFKVKTDHDSPIDFDARAKSHVDIVVRQHDYAVNGSTGWHSHPGPIFITVTKGQITFYEVDDPTCTPKIVNAGEGYVDTGHGHIGRNETGALAQDMSVILAPVGQPFRTDLPPLANPSCGF
jgi:quercetin dioxygenase-like cupin family protein